ncbi:MAG: TonB-dependent receptor [Acidobacteria bacterium]|nr:TonB-dependent receptor [Acidobacteriota bacterium]MBI3656292.1 TonB-dependent receptor [Acidobacteriota bacterium]
MARKPAADRFMLMMVSVGTVLILAMVGSIPALAQSQASTAVIEGTIADQTGGILPGAAVVIKNVRTGLTRSLVSDEKGYYSAALLPVGAYEVNAAMPGFATAKRTDIRLTIGQLLTVDLRLAVSGATTEVTVTEQAPIVEASRTQVSTTVDDRAVANLPVNGRNFLDFVLLTPGVARDPRGGDISFGGLRGTLNSVQIDGADNNNTFFGQALGRTGSGRAPYQFSQDAVQEFQVNTNSYSPEFGRAGGAVINVVTKSGTNEFHGSAFEFYRDRALNANTWLNNKNGARKSPYHFNQFGGNVGGPLVKNKLFFFFDYDGQRNNNPQVISPGAGLLVQNLPESLRTRAGNYNRTFDQDVYLVKVDWQAHERHRLTGRFNHQGFTGTNLENSGQTSALEHTGNSLVKTDTLTLALNSTVTARVLNEFRFQVGRDEEPGKANSDSPEATILQSGQTVLVIGRNNFSPRETRLRRFQFVDNVSIQRSRHTWKFGADTNIDRIKNFFPGLFGGSYTFTSVDNFIAGSPSSFIQAFAGPNTTGPLTFPNSADIAWFVNDDFRVTPRLTLSLGLRYDVQILAQPPARNSDPQLAAAGIRTDQVTRDKNNFGPRFGFAWRPLTSDRLVVRGGYGIFYARTPAIMLAQAHSQNGVNVVNLTFTGPDMPTYPNRFSSLPGRGSAATPSLYFFDPDFRNAYVQQGSLGMEIGLGRDMSLSSSYLFVKGTHLTRTQDINLSAPVASRADIEGSGSLSFLSFGARPYDHFLRLSRFTSNANSVYHGWALQLNRRFSHNYQFLASYTLSKVIDDAPDATSVVVGNPGDDAKIVQHPTRPNLDRSLGVTDQRHRFVLSGIWDLKYAQGLSHPVARTLLGGWSLAWIFTAQSGRPFAGMVGADLNNDGNRFSDRAPQEGRNIYTTPKTITWDPRITWQVPLYERLRVQFIAEAFNLFNRTNFSSVNTTKFSLVSFRQFSDGRREATLRGQSNFATARDTFDPRIFQLAVKFVF